MSGRVVNLAGGNLGNLPTSVSANPLQFYESHLIPRAPPSNKPQIVTPKTIGGKTMLFKEKEK